MEIDPNMFQINMPNNDDKKRIVEERPWMMDDQMLVLNRWVEGIEEENEAFVIAHCGCRCGTYMCIG